MTSRSLQPDGRPVRVGDVTISTPGLVGRAEVSSATTRARRALRADPFADALARTDMREQRSVELDLATAPRSRAALPAPVAAARVTVPAAPAGNGQVALLQGADGSMRWLLPMPTADGARALAPASHVTFELPAPAAPAGARGILGVAGKWALKTFAFPLLDKVTGSLANRFAAQWEAKAHPHRLRFFTPEDYQSGDVAPLTAPDLEALNGKPTLLFVHGTMSLSHTGFGSIPRATMQTLYKRYEGRVIGFDHPTVSVSPTKNAQWLARAVRGGQLRVDVVAHSRGGLVARVLTERPDTAKIVPGSLAVRRLVMVGTPNQGTALANSQHMLSYVDRLTNLLSVVPDNGVTDALSIIISVVKQLAAGAFGGLPGLTAMRPGGRWLTELNQRRPTRTKYFAVSSNFEPATDSPLVIFARDRLTDSVFDGTANDLVVPDGGVWEANAAARFPVRDRLTFDAGKSVDHSSYWTTKAFQRQLVDWLA